MNYYRAKKVEEVLLIILFFAELSDLDLNWKSLRENAIFIDILFYFTTHNLVAFKYTKDTCLLLCITLNELIFMFAMIHALK